MRIHLFVLALLVPLTLQSSTAQHVGSAEPQKTSKFVGVWRGQFDNLPGVDLVISDEGEAINGAILFYLHKRTDTNSSYTSTPGLPGPLLNLRDEGQILRFQVSHRLAHPPRTLHDPPADFQLKLTDPDQAELINESEGARGLPMKRTDY
ncbi:MAG TPA: hypothetical protein VN753_09655 [Terracidiphilus sp.]|jgi:hypothetical protein|nr:hypothetical protein [Terracidiphilus sp.]